MGMHRHNKSAGQGGGKWGYNAPWYVNNCKRVRRRRDLAKLSRRINRAK